VLLPIELTSFEITDVYKTKVTIDITVSEIVLLSYRISLKDTDIPTDKELIDQGPAKFLESECTYGYYLVDDTLSLSFELDDL